MLVDLLIIVFGIGLIGGGLSGLFGIGGSIITAPLLLYVPGFFGVEPLSMHLVSGLTITQSLFVGLAGAAPHRRSGYIDRKLALVMSVTIFAASIIGATGSKYFSHDLLLVVFAVLALVAAILIFLPWGKLEIAPEYVKGSFSTPGAMAVALIVGLFGGLVGQGGSYILIPMMVYLLRVPLRMSMGSNLVIVFFSSLAGFTGKAVTGQVHLYLAAALLLGVIPGSVIGSWLSHKVPTAVLRYGLGLFILTACVQIVFDLLS
jgi:uncharacterized membrane protein YfcA